MKTPTTMRMSLLALALASAFAQAQTREADDAQHAGHANGAEPAQQAEDAKAATDHAQHAGHANAAEHAQHAGNAKVATDHARHADPADAAEHAQHVGNAKAATDHAKHADSADAAEHAQHAGHANAAAAPDAHAGHGAAAPQGGHAAHAMPQDDHEAMQHAGHGAMQHGDAEGSSMPAHAGQPLEAERPPSDHVAPPPPQHVMGDMSAAEMVEVMGMDDRAAVALFALDRLEAAKAGAQSWSAQVRIGGDFDKLHLRSEGERRDGRLEHADAELLWSHAIAPFWDTQLGVRRDFGQGPDRTWAAFGVQGMAPYWFELSATGYVGEQGRTALRLEADYDLLLTQRLVLQPRLELNAYGKDDPAAHLGSGLSDASAGLRLRYEIHREFAPYVGVEWTRSFGTTADFARAHGEDVSDVQWVVGVRAWF